MISALLLGAAFAGSLLDRIPSEYLNDPRLRTQICEKADRLLIVKIDNAVSRMATPAEVAAGHVFIVTDLTVRVERQVARAGLGPPATTLRWIQAGGTVDGIKLRSSRAMFSNGQRWALALLYGGGNWDSPSPLVLEAFPLKPTPLALPSRARLNAALAEYCDG